MDLDESQRLWLVGSKAKLCTVLTEQKHPPALQAQPGSDSGQTRRMELPPSSFGSDSGARGESKSEWALRRREMTPAGREGLGEEAMGPGEARGVPEAAPVWDDARMPSQTGFAQDGGGRGRMGPRSVLSGMEPNSQGFAGAVGRIGESLCSWRPGARRQTCPGPEQLWAGQLPALILKSKSMTKQSGVGRGWRGD